MKDNNLIGILIWIVGLIISLTVGSGMISNTLNIPSIPSIITITCGWTVIIGATTSAVFAIFNK
jgi:hypothetical protein